MRAGVCLLFALGLLCPFSGCAGGYPLPPTPCDELCHVTRGLNCSDRYEPAACVLACESSHLSDEACRPQFNAQLDCFKRNPGASRDLCFYQGPGQRGRCDVESSLLTTCVSALNAGYGFER